MVVLSFLKSDSGNSLKALSQKIAVVKLFYHCSVYIMLQTFCPFSFSLSLSKCICTLLMWNVFLTVAFYGFCCRSLRSNQIRVLSDFVFSEYSSLERLWVFLCCFPNSHSIHFLVGLVIIQMFLHSVCISMASSPDILWMMTYSFFWLLRVSCLKL